MVGFQFIETSARNVLVCFICLLQIIGWNKQKDKRWLVESAKCTCTNRLWWRSADQYMLKAYLRGSLIREKTVFLLNIFCTKSPDLNHGWVSNNNKNSFKRAYSVLIVFRISAASIASCMQRRRHSEFDLFGDTRRPAWGLPKHKWARSISFVESCSLGVVFRKGIYPILSFFTLFSCRRCLKRKQNCSLLVRTFLFHIVSVLYGDMNLDETCVLLCERFYLFGIVWEFNIVRSKGSLFLN